METTINERVIQLRNKLNLNQGEFSELVGTSQASLSRLEAGATNPHKSTLRKIVEATKVDSDWLLTGKGEMTFEGEAKTETKVSENGTSKAAYWKDEAYKRLEEAYESSKSEIQFLRSLVKSLAPNANFNESFDLVGFHNHLKSVETVRAVA